MITIRHVCAALLLLTIAAAGARAQTTRDSVAIWTEQLGHGPVDDRAHALTRLAELTSTSLPARTQQAMIAELRRLNRDRLTRTPWDDEATGEYYMDLVGAVAALETREAYRALIPAIGVSPGVGQRVAQLGDEAVPELRALIDRGFETDVALGTLGFVTFWADSTSAPLSLASRSAILQTFLQAYGSSAYRTHLGLLMAIRNAKDPALLPLARAFAAKARKVGNLYVANSLTPVIATLETRSRQRSLADLLHLLQRHLQSLCERADQGGRQAFCQAVQTALAEHDRHLERGEREAARVGLLSVLGAAERARTRGDLTPAECLLLAGEIREMLARSW